MSLRQPQTESLGILHNALEAVPDLRDSHARSPDELKAMQKALSSQFPTLTDFEREFPSMCFALATGVGKPQTLRCDNGPEFLSKELGLWANKHGIVVEYNHFDL